MYKTASRPMYYTGPVSSIMNVTTNSHKWIGYVALALAVIALRFLCCA